MASLPNSSGAHILVVDDEDDILELIRYNLTRAGHTVRCVRDGPAALDAVRTALPDLIVLDRMMPGMDGIQVCKALRADPSCADLAVMMVTAKGADPDMVDGLSVGADDYVVKPFSPAVLVARVAALLRRKGMQSTVSEPAEPILQLHGVTIDPGRHRVSVADERIDLTPTEFGILQLLAGRPGWVFSRMQIVDRVKGENTVVTERSVDVQVSALRKKLGGHGTLVETVRGLGYRCKE